MISIKDKSNIENLYEEDDPSRLALSEFFKKVLSRLKCKGYGCLASYTAGLNIDFCRACLDLDMLDTVYIPYKDNDKKWPTPYQKNSKQIIKKAKSIKIMSRGGFNTKKINQVQDIIEKNSKIILLIERRNCNFIVTIQSYEH